MGCMFRGCCIPTFWLLVCVSVMMTVMTLQTTAATSRPMPQQENEDDTDTEQELEAGRLSSAAIQTHIRSLSVVGEKVAPIRAVPAGSTVDMKVDVAVMTVLGVSETSKTMTSNLYIVVYWHDAILRWNFSEYEGVRSVEMAASAIWTPDLYIFNSLHKRLLIEDSAIVSIQANGSVSIRLDIIVETLCDVELSQYPYDVQNCSLVFLSKYSPRGRIFRVDGTINPAWNAALMYSSDWLLEKGDSGDSVDQMAGTIIPSFSVSLRRKTLFYTTCVVLPMVLTSYMNTLVFLLPLQSGEKISFLVTIFVSTSVFTSFFTGTMPRGLDSVPATITLLVGVIVESFLVLLATLFVLAWGESHAGPRCDAQRVEGPHAVTTTTPRMAPAEPLFSEKDSNQSDRPPRAHHPAVMESTEKRRTCNAWMTTRRLDRSLFVMAFVANSAFLASVYLNYRL